MRSRGLLILLVLVVFSVAFPSRLPAQATPPTTQPMPGMGAPNPQLEAKEPNIPASTPIITIEGFCQDPAAKPCQTVVTKADFEKLMRALDPNMQPQGRQSLADQYSKILVMAGDARKHNVENEPRSQEVMRFVQTQVLANLYNQRLQDDAKEMPAADLEKYYNEHKTDYDEATVRRIYIPRNLPPDAKKLSDAERATLAADIDKRAKAGEDFNALEKEVFDKFGIKSAPPPTDMGAQRRTNFSPEEGPAIFALEAGKVSDVISTQIGDFVYKVVSKRTLTLEEARADIQANLQRQKYQSELSAVFAPVTVKLNPDYFGPNASVSLPGRAPEPPAPPAARPAAPPTMNPAAAPKPAAPARPAAKPPGN